jgi:hypothetical protein
MGAGRPILTTAWIAKLLRKVPNHLSRYAWLWEELGSRMNDLEADLPNSRWHCCCSWRPAAWRRPIPRRWK